MEERDLISTADAAQTLGVSQRQVRRLAEAGELSARRIAGRWLIDAEAVRRRSRSTPLPGRPLAPNMAWTVLNTLAPVLGGTGGPSDRPSVQADDRRVRHRVRILLEDAPPTQHWDQWLRHRASAKRFWVHPGLIDRLTHDGRVHPAGGSAVAAAGLGIATGDDRSVYVGERVVDEVLAEYRARPSDQGQVVVMVVPDGVPLTSLGGPGGPINAAAALVDLLASPDARERHIAAAALDEARQDCIAASRPTGHPS